jgi:hypothetical protein
MGKVTEFITFEMLAVTQATRPQAKAVLSRFVGYAFIVTFI